MKKGSFIPNIELKFVKNDLDRYSLEHRRHVKLADRSSRSPNSAELDALMPAVLDRAFKGELCKIPSLNLSPGYHDAHLKQRRAQVEALGGGGLGFGEKEAQEDRRQGCESNLFS